MGEVVTMAPTVMPTVTAYPEEPKCGIFQEALWDYSKNPATVRCGTTLTSVIAAPGRIIGTIAGRVFPDTRKGDLEMWGHVVTAVLVLGGTIYFFTRK